MAKCKTAVVPLLTHWSYCSLALSHRLIKFYSELYEKICLIIYIIITKNIRFLLWNRGGWRFFHDTYLTIEVQGIRCTNHLHDSCPLTDVNPHFTAPGCRYYFKIGLLWRHRHMGLSLTIVTSQWPIVPTGIYGRIMLRSARVKGIVITSEALNYSAHGFIILHIVVEWFIVHYGTLWDQTIYTRFGLICLFTLLIIFGLPCFNTGH